MNTNPQLSKLITTTCQVLNVPEQEVLKRSNDSQKSKTPVTEARQVICYLSCIHGICKQRELIYFFAFKSSCPIRNGVKVVSRNLDVNKELAENVAKIETESGLQPQKSVYSCLLKLEEIVRRDKGASRMECMALISEIRKEVNILNVRANWKKRQSKQVNS